jgi:branched-chain amino acid transport system substrate-binding protein
MRMNVLARGRAPSACACAALAAVLAGCAAPSGSSVTASGRSLTIYAGSPPGGAGGQEAQDILDAEQLALQQNGSSFGGFSVRLVKLNGKKISDNARTAIQDKSAIAYLGELTPGSSADSVGITNAQDLLQVSPADTAIALTQSTPAVSNSPKVYFESQGSYGYTFARVVPTAALEAAALASQMQTLHVSKLYVANDGSDYGKALALALRNRAASAGISVTSAQSGADGAFYAGSSTTAAAAFFNGVASANPSAKLFGPSALSDPAFVSTLSPQAQSAVYVSSPGFYKDFTPAGQKFQADFQGAYGHAPAPEAIFGYEAMAAVLAVLREAGNAANNRATVARDFLSLKNRQSVLGTYSISAGDISLAPFVISRVERGQLVPFNALQEQG